MPSTGGGLINRAVNPNSKAQKPDDDKYKFLKDYEDTLNQVNKLRISSIQKQEEIITSASVPNKKELLGFFVQSKLKHLAKISDVKALGKLGVKVEDLRLNLERRYEFMLQEINSKIEALTKYFNSLLGEVKGEAFNYIIKEKDQNLNNIKENITDVLIRLRTGRDVSGARTWDGKNALALESSFTNFFDFFESFKEEYFNIVVSRCSQLKVENLKNQLLAFKNSYLENLYITPKGYTSELLRFFETQTHNSKTETKLNKKFGDVFQTTQTDTNSITVEKLPNVFDPEMDADSKAPMLSIINDEYLLVVTRSDFKIMAYDYGPNESNVPMSKFYTNHFKTKGEKLMFKDVYKSSDLPNIPRPQPMSFHSVSVCKTTDNKYYLLLGGKICVDFDEL